MGVDRVIGTQPRVLLPRMAIGEDVGRDEIDRRRAAGRRPVDHEPSLVTNSSIRASVFVIDAIVDLRSGRTMNFTFS